MGRVNARRRRDSSIRLADEPSFHDPTLEATVHAFKPQAALAPIHVRGRVLEPAEVHRFVAILSEFAHLVYRSGRPTRQEETHAVSLWATACHADPSQARAWLNAGVARPDLVPELRKVGLLPPSMRTLVALTEYKRRELRSLGAWVTSGVMSVADAVLVYFGRPEVVTGRNGCVTEDEL